MIAVIHKYLFKEDVRFIQSAYTNHLHNWNEVIVSSNRDFVITEAELAELHCMFYYISGSNFDDFTYAKLTRKTAERFAELVGIKRKLGNDELHYLMYELWILEDDDPLVSNYLNLMLDNNTTANN